MKKLSLKVTTKSINSKSLSEQLIEYGSEAIIDTGIKWSKQHYRDYVVDYFDAIFEEAVVDEKIIQYDIICDMRNNLASEMSNGRYHFDVTFKETNCINTSKIFFEIQIS